MSKNQSALPQPVLHNQTPPTRSQKHHRLLIATIVAATITLLVSSTQTSVTTRSVPPPHVQASFDRSLALCKKALGPLPGPPADFHERTKSDRYADGTPDVLIKNATIWTGNDDGHEVFRGDVVLSRGLIKAVGGKDLERLISHDAVVVDAKGAWLTPGIFDMHSHIGVDSLPNLSGAVDINSRQKPILPYLRSFDGFNTHDLMFERARSGGVTTSLVLPGSANNIGGQAFLFKLRDTKEKTPQSMVLEAPFDMPFAAAEQRDEDPPRWRRMKHACGENIRRVYGQTRLDLAWNFRSSYDKARSIKRAQDDFCAGALAAAEKGEVVAGSFPEDLEWEALVDVLREKVKVNTHCYEATDLQAFVDHTREFEFPLAAFHHAHETYLVPDLLKQTYGGTPAVALFATNGRYKREAWRGSEFAPKILAENNITVIMKSDHPVLNSQYLIFEAQQAHHFGLPENLALASLTTSPARVQGIDHRIGFLRAGYDADLVLWDSHPLNLGATPQQVFIDGIAQLKSPYTIPKPDLQTPPTQASLVIPEDPAEPGVPKVIGGNAVFTNISTIYSRTQAGGGIESLVATADASLSVAVKEGKIVCAGSCASYASYLPTVNLRQGTVTPGFVGFGPGLGLIDIVSEESTKDGSVFDPLDDGTVSSLQEGTARAVDGLQLGGKHLRYAEKFGVTKAVTAPLGDGMFRGASVGFRTGAKNVLEKGALLKDVVALHLTIGHDGSKASISTQIGVLRRLLIGSAANHHASSASAPSTPDYYAAVAIGQIPLVVNVWKADHMAALLRLKAEVESTVGASEGIRMIFHGGQEAHLIAKEIAKAGVGVIVSPPRPLPESWDERRAPPSLPIEDAPLPVLLERAGVKVGLGVPEEWQVIQLGWEAGWAVRNGGLTKGKGVEWLTVGLEDMLGLEPEGGVSLGNNAEFVAWEGDPLDFGSHVVGIVENGAFRAF